MLDDDDAEDEEGQSKTPKVKTYVDFCLNVESHRFQTRYDSTFNFFQKNEINSCTIQGSILGPILYAIYFSPLFDLIDLSNLADDNFTITWHKSKHLAII